MLKRPPRACHRWLMLRIRWRLILTHASVAGSVFGGVARKGPGVATVYHAWRLDSVDVLVLALGSTTPVWGRIFHALGLTLEVYKRGILQ
jgi:hypothetical protein